MTGESSLIMGNNYFGGFEENMKIGKGDWAVFIIILPLSFIIYLDLISYTIDCLNQIHFLSQNYYWNLFYEARGVSEVKKHIINPLNGTLKIIRTISLLIEITVFVRLYLFLIFPTYMNKSKEQYRVYDFFLLYVIKIIKHVQNKCDLFLERFFRDV